MKFAEITVYTSEGALSYIVNAYEGFDEAITEALGKGITVVTTVEGSTLLLNPQNAVAVEVKMCDDIPPVSVSKIDE